MPVTPGEILPVISGATGSSGCLGVSSFQLNNALTQGLFTFCKSSVIINTVDFGTAGIGRSTIGAVFYAPGALTPILIGNAKAILMSGAISETLLTNISIAICTAISAGIPQTTHLIVGNGSGNGTLAIKEPASGIEAFKGAFAANGLATPMAQGLADAIANALNATISTAAVAVQIAGSPSPVAATGYGTGILI